MKNYCKDMIELSPEYIFHMPSSTTLKYHNATQCKGGGQLYHILMVAEIMNYILELDYIIQMIESPVRRDCMRTAAILHDMQKTEGGSYTTHTHPLAARRWILETTPEHDIEPWLKEYIGELVASHSGQWNKGKKSDALLPLPKTPEEFFVHLCDYLGSRQNLDMIYDADTIREVSGNGGPAAKEQKDDVFPFGKYKGYRIEDIDRSYLAWTINNCTNLEDGLRERILSRLRGE